MIPRNSLLSAGVAVVALMATYPAFADDASVATGAATSASVAAQIQTLRKQIQQQQQQIQQQQKQIQQQEQQLESLVAGVNQTKAQAQQAQAAATAAQTAATQAAATTSSIIDPHDYSTFHFGNATLHVGGKLQVDEPLIAESNDPTKNGLGAQGNIRRMYLDLRGTYDPDWAYRLEFGSTSGAFGVAWAYFQYNGLKPFSTTVGYQKTEFSLDNQTADEYRIFTEGPLPSQAFVSSKEIGITESGNGTWWQAAGGFFNGTATSAPVAGTNGAWQVSGRAVLFPINQNGTTVEFGGSASDQNAKSTNTFTLSTPPEENTVGVNFVSTGAIPNVQSMYTTSVEASAQTGSALVQGEWMTAMPEHDTLTKAIPKQPYYSGWYAQASYVITGENHPFDPVSGTYKGVDPAHPFDPWGTGGLGAFEVAGRYSYVNLTDQGGEGTATAAFPQGIEKDTTLAFNWYLNKNVRGELDWTHVFDIKAPTTFTTGNVNGVNADIVEVRGQVIW